MKCPVCQKEFNEHTGRRPKKFCSDECKVKFWNAQKRVVENNKPENKQRLEDERNTEHDAGKNHEQPMDENLMQIQKFEDELKNLPDVGFGKQRRAFINKQIVKLKRQLK